MEADLAFHLLLCQLSGNSMLVEAWQRLEGRMRVAILNGADGQAPMMARDRHLPIVEVIERGDVDAAVRVIDEHITAPAERIAEATESDRARTLSPRELGGAAREEAADALDGPLGPLPLAGSRRDPASGPPFFPSHVRGPRPPSTRTPGAVPGGTRPRRAASALTCR